LRLEPRALDRFAARLRPELRAALAGLDPPTLLDPGALDDPVVRGLHLRRELVVRDHARGDAHADTEDATAKHPEWLPRRLRRERARRDHGCVSSVTQRVTV